ncbi:hypothetical protein LJR296_008120 [Cupriavidus necator]|uniref:hypothetical protein n=1 Tax=Cupriavidus necator TaxID=106590 RepID=UPI003ED0B706
MSGFKKTRIMNIIGAIGLAIMGIALFVNKLGEQSAGVLATISAFYGALVAVPTGTACALSETGSRRLQRWMLWANWSLIVFWFLGLVATIWLRHPLGTVLLGALVLVVPQAINIRAFRNIRATNRESDHERKGSYAG